jgi:NtrC-family two-component system sensor histidine kinase KinB
MGIRTKILSGFLILATLLLVAGAWSIYELRNIGLSVQKILDENYKSIDAAKVMTEALEREDSAILLLLLGKRDEGRAIMKTADDSFQEALEIAQNNITIPGEQDLVNTTIKAYEKYKTLWVQPLVSNKYAGDLHWYFSQVHVSFLQAKLAVSNLMNINTQTMYKTASHLENRAHRATMPGIIAMVSAFIFAIVFSFLVNVFIIGPIVKLTSGIQDYLDSGRRLNVRVETDDEISKLISSVERLIDKSSK